MNYAARAIKVPLLQRVVVAIDPAVTVSEDSDETGIVVAALGVDNHGYVLADESGKYAPAEWARKAVALYHRFGADRIIAETNQGGAMVETTIRAIDANVAYRGVTAKRGQLLRAEPVSALYEQFRVHHVGTFPVLEDQMCTFAGGGDSPDRLDALCYAITELMCKPANDGIIEFTRLEAEKARTPFGAPSVRPPPVTVRMRPPVGTSVAFGRAGQNYLPGPDGTMQIETEDVAPLRMAGFEEGVDSVAGLCDVKSSLMPTGGIV